MHTSAQLVDVDRRTDRPLPHGAGIFIAVVVSVVIAWLPMLWWAIP